MRPTSGNLPRWTIAQPTAPLVRKPGPPKHSYRAAWKEAIMRYLRLLLLVSFVLPCLTTPAAAQQIRFVPNFSGPGVANLQLNNSQVVNSTLQMTPPTMEASASSAYFNIGQPVTQGFFTYFSFQMVNTLGCCSPGDGFSFIVQNSTATDSTQGATGAGLTAVGSAMGGVGYSGINNSLAVEFDILENDWDPNANHIAIQTCGGAPSMFNSPVHEPGVYTIGNNDDITSCLLSPDAINTNLASNLGPICSEDTCMDSPVHQVVIEYTPPMGEEPGSLQVYLDPQFQPGTHVPILGAPTVLNVPYNFVYSGSNPLGLVPTNIQNFLVGFTASLDGDATPTINILSWEFTPHSPTQITQQIQNGGTLTNFPFGGHQFGVTYPSDFMNCNPDCIDMTVTATPENQQDFYMNRLMGTNFANENCIIYLQTGGNCIDYSVTCQENGQNVKCPFEENDDIAICTQFETSQPISQLNADFLKADPIGSNNWCSIFTMYTPQNPPDSIDSGKGQGFSDIVATYGTTISRMPMCFQGGLKETTKRIEKTTSKQAEPKQPQGNNYCPPID